MTQIDPIDLEKDKPEVDLGLLLSNLPGAMSVMSKKEDLKGRAVTYNRESD